MVYRVIGSPRRFTIYLASSTKMADLVSKPGTKSIVWDYFGLKKGTNGETVDDGMAIC